MSLKAGETKKITFCFALDFFAFPNETNNWVLKSGDFEFYIAKNSDDVENKLSYTLEKGCVIDKKKRCLYATAEIS